MLGVLAVTYDDVIEYVNSQNVSGLYQSFGKRKSSLHGAGFPLG